jgi:hypothetical protein
MFEFNRQNYCLHQTLKLNSYCSPPHMSKLKFLKLFNEDKFVNYFKFIITQDHNRQVPRKISQKLQKALQP